MYPNESCQPCTNCPEVEVVVPAPPSCVGQPCEEIMPGMCVKYTGPAIPCLNIVTNETMDSFLQKLAANICGLCPLPVVSTLTTCAEDGTSFTIKLSTNHVSVGTTVEVQYKNSAVDSAWTSAANIVTTGVALNDFVEITIPLNGSQTSTYLVRARRKCVDAYTGWATVTITTPLCACLNASGLVVTP